MITAIYIEYHCITAFQSYNSVKSKSTDVMHIYNMIIFCVTDTFPRVSLSQMSVRNTFH